MELSGHKLPQKWFKHHATSPSSHIKIAISMLATSLLSAHVLLKQCLACDVLYFPHDSDPSSITSWISQLVAAISESCERRAPDHIYVIWIPQNRVIKILQTQHYKLNASQNSTNSTSYPNTTNSISFRLHAPVLLQPSLECDVIMMNVLLALLEKSSSDCIWNSCASRLLNHTE